MCLFRDDIVVVVVVVVRFFNKLVNYLWFDAFDVIFPLFFLFFFSAWHSTFDETVLYVGNGRVHGHARAFAFG